MYRVIEPVSIGFYYGPYDSISFEKGDVFHTRFYEDPREGEVGVIVTDLGDEYEDFSERDLELALKYGEVEEI